MSAFITYEDAKLAIEHLISTNDFLDLINRAAERLYRKGATPGWTKEMDLGTPDANGEVVTFFADTSHVLAFKVNDCPYYITPLSTTYKTDRSGADRFVDMGYRNDTERVYRLPGELMCKDGDYSGYHVKALVRPAYKPVVNLTDTFPFQNMEPLKLAAMAIQYEDESDMERSMSYMDAAVAEREYDSMEFRGPQVLTIGIHDPASDEATESII